MLKRPEQVLKLLCLLVAAVLCLEVARVAARGKPLKSLTIPALPTFAAADSTNSNPNAKGTNAPAGTNASSGGKSGTNQASPKTDTKGTNKPGEAAKPETNATNVAKAKGTNASEVKAAAAETNLVASSTTTNAAATNSNSATATNIIGTEASNATNGTSTNVSSATNHSSAVAAKPGTNAVASGASTNKTNSIEKIAGAGTNSPIAQKSAAKGAGPGGRPDMGKKGPDVPPATKARIDRITQSEILAAVMHPMPMALLGIGGDEALLRSPEGQTGMLKEGKELGSIKLLKIGINRVLIEEKGEKKELTIFSGFGGESLMPKEDKKADDAKKDAKLEPKKTEEKDKKPNEPTKKSA
jgi:hypothetical protein